MENYIGPKVATFIFVNKNLSLRRRDVARIGQLLDLVYSKQPDVKLTSRKKTLRAVTIFFSK